MDKCPTDLNEEEGRESFKLWPPETASKSIKNKPGNKYLYVNTENEVENQLSFFFSLKKC